MKTSYSIPDAAQYSFDNQNVIAEGELNVFPNPAQNWISINTTLAKESPVNFILSNAQGKQIKSYDFGIRKAGNFNAEFQLGGLSNGMYMLTFIEGNKLRTTRFMLVNE